uniref:Uncharacterized protein n=1 Tax=Labrus bergylta TaxID=56723 RepID=A0A3Q3E8E0_9LABR
TQDLIRLNNTHTHTHTHARTHTHTRTSSANMMEAQSSPIIKHISLQICTCTHYCMLDVNYILYWTCLHTTSARISSLWQNSQPPLRDKQAKKKRKAFIHSFIYTELQPLFQKENGLNLNLQPSCS